MKRNIEEISAEEWKETLGDLGDDELEAIRAEKSGQEIDFDADRDLHRLLEEMGKETTTDGDDVPGLPDSVRKVFETERNQVFDRLAQEEWEVERAALQKKAEQRRAARQRSPLAKFFRPAVLSWAASAALIAVGAYFLVTELNRPNRGYLAATTASVLTPGDITGFTEPTFTWDTDNGGIVKLVVVEIESSKTVATLDRAFSPSRFTSMEVVSSLQAGKSYRVTVVNAHEQDEVLATQEFATLGEAAGRPERAADLEGVINQCRTYLAENRAGDAWMLWAELTPAEKADTRMEELRVEILAVLLS